MEKNKIKFAVVGCGHIGKRHAKMIIENSNCELVALCDIRPIHELDLENSFSEIFFYKSIDELLQSNL